MNMEVTTKVPATEVSGSTATVETPQSESTPSTPAETKAEVKKEKKAGKSKKEPAVRLSKTAFIDKLYLQHTKNGKTQVPKGTVELIFKEVCKAKYIDPKNEREVEATMNTIHCRPWHMRKAGKLAASTRGSNKGADDSKE